MKTLLFTLEYPPFNGGVANYYGNLAKYWPIDEKLVILDNSKKELLPRQGILAWLPSIFCLKRKLTQNKIDYLIVGHILPLGTAAYIVSFFRPIKYAVVLHGMDLAFALQNPHKQFISKLILKKANNIICANSFVQEKLFEFLPGVKNKTTIVNPGIESGVPDSDPDDIENIKNSYNLEDKIILLSLGRLVKRKGVDRTIEALAQLPEELNHNLIYFIAGAGPQEEYLKQLVLPQFVKKIVFLGELKDFEKWAWLKLCDIFVMPSRDISGDFEGFGIVYLEANLCNKPVIAGTSGGVRDAVVNEETGLLVDPDKVDEIGRSIVRLMSDPALRERLGKQGHDRAIREFNWEKQAIKFCKYIK